MSHLVQLSKINETPGIPIKASTAYKWRTLKKYPQMFTVFGGKVFIDTRVLEQILEAGRGKAAQTREVYI